MAFTGSCSCSGSLPPQPVGHFHLKAVSVRADLIKIDGLQRAAAETFVAAGRVAALEKKMALAAARCDRVTRGETSQPAATPSSQGMGSSRLTANFR
jgi:hypothetical protein